jgi:hypothetical protein
MTAVVRQAGDEFGGGGACRRPTHAPKVADVLLEADGTLVLRFHGGSRLDAALTSEVMRAHVEVAGGRPRPVLADVRGLVSVDRASRQLAASPDVTAATACMAIIVGNPVTRTLGNFFIRVTTPSYPTRLFADERLARQWLRESGR